MKDKLSRREDRALLRALESVVLTEFPNPERKGCPGTGVLGMIARKEISMRDPAHEHVGSCSPCFRELLELRAEIRRKKTWTAATAATIVILTALIGYYSLQAPRVTPRTDTPAAPVYESVSVDLRGFQTTRSASQNPPSTIPQVPRRPLALTIYLPVGSLEGEYEVQIENTGQKSLAAAIGNAVIEDGITKLRVNLDTTSIPDGEYQIGIRPKGFDWRQYPVVVR